MIEDEEVRPAKPGRLEKLPLDALSVGELRDYIGELTKEIARAEAAITHKESARGYTDRFFAKPS